MLHFHEKKCIVEDSNGHYRYICLESIRTIAIYYDIMLLLTNETVSPYVFCFRDNVECLKDLNQLKEELMKLGYSLCQVIDEPYKVEFNVKQEEQKAIEAGEGLVWGYLYNSGTNIGVVLKDHSSVWVSQIVNFAKQDGHLLILRLNNKDLVYWFFKDSETLEKKYKEIDRLIPSKKWVC